MHSAEIYPAKQSSAKLDVPELGTRGSDICRGSNDLGKIAAAEPVD
jgi:hypothetical protein